MFAASALELIGSFLLVAIGTSAIAVGAPWWVVATAFGFGLALPVMAFSRLTGGHFNPAVTSSMNLWQETPLVRLLPYAIAQVAGAYAGSWAVKLGHGVSSPELLGAPSPADSIHWMVAAGIEATGTGLLVFMIIFATQKMADATLAPFTIGGALGAGVWILGPLTGGSFNPARYLGPVLVSGAEITWQSLVIYVVAPIIGGLLATIIAAFLEEASPD